MSSAANSGLKPTIAWHGSADDGHLELLDQTRLPTASIVLRITQLVDVVDAIRRLAVRGAPAIGVAAGYGVVVGVRERLAASAAEFASSLDAVCDTLAAARPTAVNLGWAVERLRAVGRAEPRLDALLAEARAIHEEDAALCRRIGEAGAELVQDGMTVLTHCNAGRLATAGDGTALAVLFEAQRRGTSFRVLADETRPLLQGARLTALELDAAGIPVEVVADSAAAGLIARGEVDLVITGADRVAANGDVANKVGTYAVSLAARAHSVPFWVAIPMSTLDLETPSGAGIPIEDRDPDEVLYIGTPGRDDARVRVAPPGVTARNPAFDITPADHLTGLITDRGRVQPVTVDSIKAVVG